MSQSKVVTVVTRQRITASAGSLSQDQGQHRLRISNRKSTTLNRHSTISASAAIEGFASWNCPRARTTAVVTVTIKSGTPPSETISTVNRLMGKGRTRTRDTTIDLIFRRLEKVCSRRPSFLSRPASADFYGESSSLGVNASSTAWALAVIAPLANMGAASRSSAFINSAILCKEANSCVCSQS